VVSGLDAPEASTAVDRPPPGASRATGTGPSRAARAPIEDLGTDLGVTAYHRQFFRTARPAAAAVVGGAAPVAGTRGLLPNAATRELSGATPPAVRRIDDKCRIHHPPLAELPGWVRGADCTVAVEDDVLHVRPASGPGSELGRFDGTRLRVPPARLQAIGVAPGEDIAIVADAGTGTVTLAAGAHLSDAFWAIGELEALRNQLSQVTAERDAAVADAQAAQMRAEVLAELLENRKTPEMTRPPVPVGR
jgi:hypothetical protein